MATTWKGTAKSAEMVYVSPTRRMVRFKATFKIVDDADPDVTLKAVPIDVAYPLVAFAGLATWGQAWQLVRDTGHGAIPSLKMMGSRLVDDWDRGASVRALAPQLPHEFGP